MWFSQARERMERQVPNPYPHGKLKLQGERVCTFSFPSHLDLILSNSWINRKNIVSALPERPQCFFRWGGPAEPWQPVGGSKELTLWEWIFFRKRDI